MNLKHAFSAFTALLLLSGCSALNISSNQNDKVVKYDNTNHIVGNKNNAIKTLVYVQKINDKVDKKVTFYIDKFPYREKFNLCSDKKDHKRIKSVSFDENGRSIPKYINQKINCESYINAFYKDNSISGSYRMNFLDQFNVEKFQGYDLLLPERTETGSNSFTLNDMQSQHDYINNIEKLNYWYIQD